MTFVWLQFLVLCHPVKLCKGDLIFTEYTTCSVACNTLYSYSEEYKVDKEVMWGFSFISAKTVAISAV